jgi:hypothetical protein
MTRDKVYTTVLKWFRDHPSATLVLPDGVFGSTNDVLQLTYITNRPRKLLVELNGQFMLVFTDPQKADVVDGNLILNNFAQVLFDWQEGSDVSPHAKVYKYGDVKFVHAAIR